LKFQPIASFYQEISEKLCNGFNMGKNLDAFNDVLRGGFGPFEYMEEIKIVLHNSEKFRISDDKTETIIKEIFEEAENVEIVYQ
jgi:RNAse (barnase) inhibitor barstar